MHYYLTVNLLVKQARIDFFPSPAILKGKRWHSSGEGLNAESHGTHCLTASLGSRPS